MLLVAPAQYMSIDVSIHTRPAGTIYIGRFAPGATARPIHYDMHHFATKTRGTYIVAPISPRTFQDNIYWEDNSGSFQYEAFALHWNLFYCPRYKIPSTRVPRGYQMVYFDLPFLLSIRPTYITYCEGDAWPRTGDRVGIKRHILLSFGRYVLQIVSLDVLMTQYIEINPRTTFIEKLH